MISTKSLKLALYLTVLLTLLLSAANVFARPTTQPAANFKMRKLVFPSKFSLGRLYVCKDPVTPHHFAVGKMVAEGLGRFVGEARGTVDVKVPEKGMIYLIASYQPTFKPNQTFNIQTFLDTTGSEKL